YAGLTLATMRQEHVDRWLSAGARSRHSIRYFLAWAVQRGLATNVTVPARKTGRPFIFADHDDQMDLLERCLTDEQMSLDLRAVGALVLLFGITPTRVVNLTADQLIERDGEHYLVL